MLAETYNDAQLSSQSLLFQLPTVSQIFGYPAANQNFFVHGGTGPGNPANNVMATVSQQSVGGGNFTGNGWNAGALTGFTPNSPSTAQLAYASSGTSTTIQWEGNTVGVYMQSVDRPSDPSNSKMGIWPQINYAAQPIYTTLASVLTHYLHLQIPTATNTAGTGTKDVYLTIDNRYSGPGGIFVATSTKIYGMAGSAIPSVTFTQDIPTSTYLINVALDPTKAAGYMTVLQGAYTHSTWSGFLPIAFSISAPQFALGLQGLQNAFGAGAVSSVDPTQYSMVNTHINAEYHFTPTTDDCTLGWSVQNWYGTLQ